MGATKKRFLSLGLFRYPFEESGVAWHCQPRKTRPVDLG